VRQSLCADNIIILALKKCFRRSSELPGQKIRFEIHPSPSQGRFNFAIHAALYIAVLVVFGCVLLH
jgi:hypothetical protein